MPYSSNIHEMSGEEFAADSDNVIVGTAVFDHTMDDGELSVELIYVKVSALQIDRRSILKVITQSELAALEDRASDQIREQNEDDDGSDDARERMLEVA